MSSGIRCGREPSPIAALVRGRVVSEIMSGLPGLGQEALWVTLHAIDGPREIGRLPPARAETQTGPQGAFTIPLDGAGVYVIAVRAERGGPVIAARRIEATAEVPLEPLLLLIPSGN